MWHYGMLKLALCEPPPDLRDQGAQAAFPPFCGCPVCVGSCVPSSVQRPFLNFPRQNQELWLQQLLNHQVLLHVQRTGVKPISNVTDSYGVKLPQNPEKFPFGEK